MDKKIIKFNDTQIQKQKFHLHKSPYTINSIVFHIIVVFNKASFGKKDFKFFIGYKDLEKIRPSIIFVPKTSAYRRRFDET